MTVQVTFAGVNYDVPEEDDSGWSDLTSYLVALSGASVGTTDSKSTRIATSTPITVSATDDYAVGVNVASASTVTLPSGTTGALFMVFDASGEAANNNITIEGTGGQTINGLDEYVINSNFGAVLLQYAVSGWNILSEKKITTENNQTNLSIIDASISTTNIGVSVTTGQSCTVIFLDTTAYFIINIGSDSMICYCARGTNRVNCISDSLGLFNPVNASTGIYVGNSGNVITVQNNTGVTLVTKIIFLAGRVSAATAWS